MEALEKLEEEERKENEERQKRREAKKRMQRSVIEYYKNQSQMLPVKATQYDDGPKKAGPLDEEDGDEVLERISEMNKALDKMVNKSGDDVPRQQKSSNE
ncbi:unnamed protein product [Nippostrongylus brasiliensis]|uniref:Complexin n=2 Tax=Nippostrongylus brasiliensis TaxID=27835 RepID=A0A0N4YS56_NIPBR|nr:hypothetical protein Q1695_009175 [Nippostrongylus brasiliensis]VDL83815.1 unnamed protein product [Nippostrongylus brasiliensis]